MNKSNIALLVDCEMDLPLTFKNKAYVYSLPSKTSYTPGEVCENTLDTDIMKDVITVLENIQNDGYRDILVMTISHNIRTLHPQILELIHTHTKLKIKVIDTLNIGSAAGMNAVLASEYIEEGMAFETIYENIKKNCGYVKTFFLVDYNKQGFSDDLTNSVTAFEPIISCNEKGECYTVAKGKGRQKAIEKILDLAIEYASIGKQYNVLIYYTGKNEMVKKERLLQRLPRCEAYIEKQIHPKLKHYTENDVMGIAVQLLND